MTSAYLVLKPAEQQFCRAVWCHPHLGVWPASVVSSFLLGEIENLSPLEEGQVNLIRQLAEVYKIKKIK